MSARGGLFGADGGEVVDGAELIEDAIDNGQRNARCNSHPTSDMMLAFRKYGVTSRRNFTMSAENGKINKTNHTIVAFCMQLQICYNEIETETIMA